MEDKTQDSQGLLYHVTSPTGILLGRKEAWPLPEQVAGCQDGDSHLHLLHSHWPSM